MSILIKTLMISVITIAGGSGYCEAPWPWANQAPPKCLPTGPAASGVSSLSLASDEVVYGLLWDQPKRIISLSPLAKNPEYSNIAQYSDISKIVTTDNIEKIAALNPAMVIAASFNRVELRNQIKQLGIRTIVSKNFDSIEAISNNILAIGKAVGCSKRAVVLAKAMNDTIDLARIAIDKNSPLNTRKVLVFSKNLVFPSHGTLFDNLMRTMGLENLTSLKGKTGWPKLSPEFVLSLNPNWLIIPAAPTRAGEDWVKSTTGVQWHRAKQLPASSRLIIPTSLVTATSQYLGPFADAIANLIRQK